jgi:hypothetical protein
LNEAVRAARLSEKPEAVAELVADFFSKHDDYLGESFKVLLPLMQIRGSRYRAYVTRDYIKRWGDMGHKSHAKPISFEVTPQNLSDRPAMAVFVDPYGEYKNKNQVRTEAIFFTTTGCMACNAAEEKIRDMKNLNPGLHVTRYDILTREGFSRNEVLSHTFQIEQRLHAVIPAVFMAGGYLIGAEINRATLQELLLRSMAEPEADMLFSVNGAKLKNAGNRIKARAKTYSFQDLAVKSFMKGMNPAPFVMMAFLLAYLINAGNVGATLLRRGADYLIALTVSTLTLWFLPQIMPANNHYLNTLNSLLITMIVISMGLACPRLFFRLVFLLKKNKSGKQKHKKPFTPEEKRVMGVAIAWGVIVAVLNLTTIGDEQVATLVYMIKSHAMVISSAAMLALLFISFLLPSSGFLGLFALASGNRKLQSLSNRHSAIKHCVWLLIWAFLLVKYVKSLI